MYQLVTAYVKLKPRNARWVEKDISAEMVSTLSATYADVVMVITYPSLMGEVRYLPIDSMINSISATSATHTTQQWLTTLENETLPVELTGPSLEPKYVRYIKAWQNGYQVEPIDMVGSPDRNISKFDLPDLLVTHPNIDPITLRKNAMISVNGFFHFWEYGDDGCYVHEGNRTVRTSNDNQIGIHSFSEVGELTFIPITEDMVSNLKEDTPLRDGAYITLPTEIDFKENTILLVIGGFLQVLDKTYTRVGRYTYKIELSKLMLLERYFESYQSIDMTGLNFTAYEEDSNLVTVSEWFSDATIMHMLTMSQTFFVVVNTRSMFEELIPLESSKLPGRFKESEYHHYPLVGAYMKTLEYQAIKETDYYVIASDITRRHRYDFHRRPWLESPAFNSGRNSAYPFNHAAAYWRLLGTQE